MKQKSCLDANPSRSDKGRGQKSPPPLPYPPPPHTLNPNPIVSLIHFAYFLLSKLDRAPGENRAPNPIPTALACY